MIAHREAWKQLLHGHGFPRKAFVISEPCRGLGSAERFFRDAGVDVTSVNEYEIDGDLRPVYEYLRIDASRLGQTNGDIQKVALDQLEDCDLLVAGPPCGPWAGNGRRMGCLDPRAQVYHRIVDVIVELAKRGKLVAFAIENSPNILSRSNGEDSMADVVMKKFGRLIPYFSCSATVVDTSAVIPTQRKRAWIRGMRGDALFRLPSGAMQAVPEPLTSFGHAFSRPKLREFLEVGVPNLNFADHWFTPKRREKLKGYEAIVQADKNRNRHGDLAVFEIDREPHAKSFISRVHYDMIPPLRTRGQAYFIMSTFDVEKPHAERHTFRCLTERERFMLSGHDPDCSHLLKRTVSLRATGNAFPTAMAAQVLLPILCQLAKAKVLEKRSRLQDTALAAIANVMQRDPSTPPKRRRTNARWEARTP